MHVIRHDDEPVYQHARVAFRYAFDRRTYDLSGIRQTYRRHRKRIRRSVDPGEDLLALIRAEREEIHAVLRIIVILQSVGFSGWFQAHLPDVRFFGGCGADRRAILQSPLRVQAKPARLLPLNSNCIITWNFPK